MNEWARRILGALPVIGCGAGLMLQMLVVKQGLPNPMTGIVVGLFALLYLYGAVVGIMLLQNDPRAPALNFLYWLTQVFQYTSVVVSYQFWSTACLTLWRNATQQALNLEANLGSAFRFSMIEPDTDTRFGINILALAVSIYLFKQYRRERAWRAAEEAAPEEQADVAGDADGAEANPI